MLRPNVASLVSKSLALRIIVDEIVHISRLICPPRNGDAVRKKIFLLGEYFSLARLTEFHNLFSKQPCRRCTFRHTEGESCRLIIAQPLHPPHSPPPFKDLVNSPPWRDGAFPTLASAEIEQIVVGLVLFLIDTYEIDESAVSINMMRWKYYKSDSSVSTLSLLPACGDTVCGRESACWEAVITLTPALLLVIPINPRVIEI